MKKYFSMGFAFKAMLCFVLMLPFISAKAQTKAEEAKMKKGEIGGVFGVYGTENVSKIQDLAVKESRLHIPLIFGLDVIHGHRTIFPIPLGVSATWDMGLIEQSSHIAAKEA